MKRMLHKLHSQGMTAAHRPRNRPSSLRLLNTGYHTGKGEYFIACSPSCESHSTARTQKPTPHKTAAQLPCRSSLASFLLFHHCVSTTLLAAILAVRIKDAFASPPVPFACLLFHPCPPSCPVCTVTRIGSPSANRISIVSPGVSTYAV